MITQFNSVILTCNIVTMSPFSLTCNIVTYISFPTGSFSSSVQEGYFLTSQKVKLDPLRPQNCYSHEEIFSEILYGISLLSIVIIQFNSACNSKM